jgi:AcrR family transcriptional regulator
MSFSQETAAIKAPREAIIDALMELAAERRWEDISITDIAERAGVNLSQFRDAFPSKGAVLAGFSRRVDKIVLDATDTTLAAEPAKERLADVLMRRLDAMSLYREGLREVVKWSRRDPMAAAALNQMALNSMRFMLEAARIGSEGPVGALKLQGLVLAWTRILDVWFDDLDEGQGATMAELDRTLTQGGRLVGYAQDAFRLTAPLRSLAGALCNARRDLGGRRRERWSDRSETGEEEPIAL